MKLIEKPAAGEFPSYASMYIDLLPDDGRILQHLEENYNATQKLIRPLPAEKLLYRYAENKWTIKEVLVHIIDDERIYAYRAMCFARGEKKPLPGFEQDDYASNSGANERDIDNIMEEYEAVRRSTIALFNGFADAALTKTGIANNNNVSVRALVYHLAGHELHHINLIRVRYLK
jgi:uncharacterized damage-inducible protein DinB